MRIIIIGPAHPFRGGIALGNELMAHDLIERGHDVEIITFTKQYPRFLFPGKTQYSENAKPNLTIRRKIHAYNPLNWFKVGNELNAAKPDLILVRFWLPFLGPAFGTILRKVKKNKHTKVIGILDNVIPHEKRLGDQALTSYFLKPVDGFITMAKSVHQDLMKFEQSKPCASHPHPIFHNFPEKLNQLEARKTLNIDLHKTTLLFFGLIRAYKGLDILLDAIAQSAYKDTIQLVIAGECYTDEANYRDQINTLQLNESVVFHNQFIPDAKVNLYFSAADLLVLPYRSATQSGVTQIAYHYHLPMIVSNVGGLPDMVPHQKVGLVTNPNPQAIQQAIDLFIRENLATEFAANFEQEIHKFSWNSFNEEILTLYAKINV